MRRLLDQLSFKKNRYARPNQDWICGRTAEGHPCPLGPDDRGMCRATGECFPVKTGDRWFCTRPEAQGGKCPTGPTPSGGCSHPVTACQPTPSLRRTRGQFTWLVVALTLGMLLLLLASGWRRQWISPGDLTVHHATSGTECSDCHTLEKTAPGALVPGALVVKHRVDDSQLCLKCHSLGAQPFSPHGASAPVLAAFTTRAKAEKSAPSLLLRASTAVSHIRKGSSDEMACATCHREHHGKDFNLAHLSQTQCQVCHSVQFTSLAKGHPEFSHYPYQRRTRIYFDHASHIQDHFPATKEHAPTSCQACHTPAVSGGKMLVNNFQQACAVCHSDSIRNSNPVAFFRVPGLDVNSLAKAGISIGQWPKDADDKITPFMELLLGAETPGGKALAALKGKDLLDLSSASPEQIAAAGKLAWAVKELLFDLEVEGQPFLLKRLQEALPPGQNAVQVAALTGGIPRAGLTAARKEWMPDLLREVPDYRRGVMPPLPAAAASSTPAAKASAPPPSDKSKAAPTDDILGAADAASSAKPAPAGDDILGGAEAAPSPTPAAKPAAAAPAGDDILADLGPATSASPSPAATVGSGTKPEAEVAADDAWMSSGGWYRAKDGFTLAYRPSGHGDPFLVAWMNASAAAPSAGSGVLSLLTNQSGPGSCAKCHSVDDAHDGVARINWTAARPEPNAHSFTKFSHTAHLSVMTEKGCQTCHVLNSGSKYGSFFQAADPVNPASANRDPAHFESNFASLPKAECATCHTARIAGDSCLLCHNYHTGAFATDMSQVARIHPVGAKKPE
jgi:hypothetical protein